jgi:nucleotide-binding universal stress UspA family protein
MTSEHTHAWQWPPRSIVAAVDFDPASTRAVAVAGLLASGGAASLHVLHAERVEMPPYFTPAQIAQLEDERQDATAEVTRELLRVVAGATTWPAAVTVVEGAPVDVILAAAADADLVALGTHGRRGPARWWLGSVAERVVRAADVPVLVTRADTSPVAEVFSRVRLVAEGGRPDAGIVAMVEQLAATVGGSLEAATALDACSQDALASATLVAVALPPGRSHWRLSDVVTETLGHCARPVLFLPER